MEDERAQEGCQKSEDHIFHFLQKKGGDEVKQKTEKNTKGNSLSI